MSQIISKYQMQAINLTNYIEITQQYSYDRGACLGQGSFGKVYVGYNKRTEKQLAVKHILKSKLRQMRGLEKRQIQAMQKLKHPNIIKYYGCCETQEDGLFMFMEICTKKDLSNVLSKQKLTEAQGMNFFEQLVSAMAYMNEQQIVHRDLKPDNLLITENNQLRIADFGTARQFYSEKDIAMTFRRCTPIYSAPQVYLRPQYEDIMCSYKQNCDVFSAGYILYELLTGKKLTEGITDANQLTSFLLHNKKRGGFNFSAVNLSANWINLLKKMLDFDPRTRINFKEVRAILKEINPSSNLVSELPREQDEKQRSTSIAQMFKEYVITRKKKHGYLIIILRVLNRYQYHKSQFIVRVYKLIVLYYSLLRYLIVAEQDLAQLYNPKTIQVNNKSISSFGGQLLFADRKRLLQYIEVMAYELNREVQQIRTIMLRQIVSALDVILKAQGSSCQKRVVLEYMTSQDIAKFKREEYGQHMQVLNRQRRVMKNLFQTQAQTQVLTNQDLKIYLTILLVSKKETAKPSENIWPPSFQEITEKMTRSQLLTQVNQQRRLI